MKLGLVLQKFERIAQKACLADWNNHYQIRGLKLADHVGDRSANLSAAAAGADLGGFAADQVRQLMSPAQESGLMQKIQSMYNLTEQRNRRRHTRNDRQNVGKLTNYIR